MRVYWLHCFCGVRRCSKLTLSALFYMSHLVACLFVVLCSVVWSFLLVMCGYITTPKSQPGKRKNQEEPNCPQPAKNPYVNPANLFRSTECLLLSLIRKEAIDEADSPMKEVFSSKTETKLDTRRVFRGRRVSDGDRLDGSYLDVSQAHKTDVPYGRLRPRSCSLEGNINNCAKSRLFRSSESLESCSSDKSNPETDSPLEPNLQSSLVSINTSGSSVSSQLSADLRRNNSRPARARPRSIGNLFDIEENREMSASSFSVHAPVAEITMRPDSTSSVGFRGLGLSSLHGSCVDVRTGPSFSRRCQSSLDLSKPAPARPPSALLTHQPEQSKSMWKTHVRMCLSICALACVCCACQTNI